MLLFSLTTTIALQFFSGTNPLTGGSLGTGPQAVLVTKGSPAWLALTFGSQVIAIFCAILLLAGLLACVSLLFSGRTATIREGLSRIRGHLLSLTGWTMVFAITGTIQSVITNLYPEVNYLASGWSLVIIFMSILTLFVIPLLVFEDKSITGAVMGSLSLFRRTWGEIIICCLIFGLLFSAFASVSLLPMFIFGFPSGNMTILGVTVALYMLVLIIVIMIGTTVFGIFLTGLYSYAKTGRVPAIFERKQGEKVIV